MALTAEYVLSELSKHADVLRGFGVKKIGLFGSVARGEGKGSSDLDFVVDLEQWTSDAFFGTAFFLEDTFHCDVDLVPIDSVRPELAAGVLKEARYVPGL